MAKPKRKAPKSKPMTQHQLFPAVVALWFGALFGLGSLAVRPSLLEELVIKSRMDLLVPAAAPPLGMTARMLIALTLAAFGAMLGVAIARRIARPRQEVRERKRTNLSTRDEGDRSYASGNAYGEASTRYPGPASADAAATAAPSVLAARRRSLAIEHEEGEFVPHDNAPLPGGAPQIFDIAAAGLNDAPQPPATAVELGSYAEPPPAAAPSAVTLDWANAAPILPPATPIVAAPAPASVAPAQPEYAPPPTQPVHEAHETQRQVFGAVPPTIPPVDQPRQIFGAPVVGDHVATEFVEAHGFRTSVFVAPEPTPLFPARAEAAPIAPEPDQAPSAAPIPQAYAPPVETAVPAEVVPVAEAAPEPTLPDPASLGIEDLSSRLAESMRRRRAARAGTPAEQADAPIAPELAAVAVPEASLAAIQADVPQAFEPPAPVAAPHSEPEAVPAFTVPPFAVPPFSVPAAAAEVPAEPEPIPAALLPLDLTGFEEDDAAAQDSLLPPRRIAFPPPVAVPAADEPEVAEEAAVAEENYASLLGVTPSPVVARIPFVRVEDPQMDEAAVEPVVIFPGQAMLAANPFAAPTPVGVDETTPFRRFDAPANAGHGQPVASHESTSAVPREEAEQALRSALANLQRMSGAA